MSGEEKRQPDWDAQHPQGKHSPSGASLDPTDTEVMATRVDVEKPQEEGWGPADGKRDEGHT